MKHTTGIEWQSPSQEALAAFARDARQGKVAERREAEAAHLAEAVEGSSDSGSDRG